MGHSWKWWAEHKSCFSSRSYSVTQSIVWGAWLFVLPVPDLVLLYYTFSSYWSICSQLRKMFSWRLLEHFLGDASAHVECVVFLEAAHPSGACVGEMWGRTARPGQARYSKETFLYSPFFVSIPFYLHSFHIWIFHLDFLCLPFLFAFFYILPFFTCSGSGMYGGNLDLVSRRENVQVILEESWSHNTTTQSHKDIAQVITAWQFSGA